MLKRMVMIILLGGFGIMMLTACNKKSSREFIEGKAAELSNVYPTEDLLFKVMICMITKKKAIHFNL